MKQFALVGWLRRLVRVKSFDMDRICLSGWPYRLRLALLPMSLGVALCCALWYWVEHAGINADEGFYIAAAQAVGICPGGDHLYDSAG